MSKAKSRKAAPVRAKSRQDESEEAFLRNYRIDEHARPSVTADVALFTVLQDQLCVLLVKRGGHPFKGKLALPGGFLEVGSAYSGQGEDLIDGAERELQEETGLRSGEMHLEQLGAFGAPARDPRMRIITVVYYGLLAPTRAARVQAGDDAREAGWVPVKKLRSGHLAADHWEILQAALERIDERLRTSSVAADLLPETFTLSELRRVHELVRGEPLDPSIFLSVVARLLEDVVLEEVREQRLRRGAPAVRYRYVYPSL